MTSPVISITSADSVTVFMAGKPFVVGADHPRYDELKVAINAGDHDLVDTILNASDRLSKALGSFGDVTVYAGHVTFQGRKIHNVLVDRMLRLINRGKNPGPYALLLDAAMRNPTRSAVDLFFPWLETARLPVLNDGRALAFKRIKNDYTDVHTGTFDHSPGRIVEIPRSLCNTDSQAQCASGLHFCNQTYLSGFNGSRVVMVAVDAADVVAFPNDHGNSKGRTQRYEVLFEIDLQTALDDTFFQHDDERLVFTPEMIERCVRANYPDGAYDAGWRVEWVQGEIEVQGKNLTKDTSSWDVVHPSGNVMDGFLSRASAMESLGTYYQHAEEATVGVVGMIIVGVAETSEETFNSRLERLEDTLAINPVLAGAGTFAERLNRIEDELGLGRGIPPQIDRLVRAEQAAGL